MPENEKRKYDADLHVAEIYDRHETTVEDIALVRRLLGNRRRLRIFEPFCGTGRILIPLAQDGHEMIGLDESQHMLARLKSKVDSQPELADRIRLIHAPVFAAAWPGEMDVVLLGGNCFYDVSSCDEQRALILRAADSLPSGGWVFLDNDDHQSPTLQPSWQKPPGQRRKAFPSGTCQDGTVLAGSTETAWFDVRGRFVHYIRRLTVTHPPAAPVHYQWRETCHPTIMADCLTWLQEAGFEVEQTFGGKDGRPYGPETPRCVVWARKR
ncbi:MAG TPA: class I SAM-dependent methyltransferase [Thermoguttaceae bacterium]|nr:class I SAM-dependent methyltransferase [Thermoguttaceae bacterium]